MTSQYVYVLGADRRGAGQNLQVCPDTFFGNRREQLLALAARHAVPVIYARREWVAAGD